MFKEEGIDDIIEKFKKLPKEQQIAITRMSLSENIPELRDFFERMNMVDENIKSMMTVLINIKAFKDDAEAQVIANYKRMLDRIGKLEADLKTVKQKKETST